MTDIVPGPEHQDYPWCKNFQIYDIILKYIYGVWGCGQKPSTWFGCCRTMQCSAVMMNSNLMILVFDDFAFWISRTSWISRARGEGQCIYIYIFNLFIYLFYHDWLSNLCLLSVQEVMDTNAVPEAREARAHIYIYIYICIMLILLL